MAMGIQAILRRPARGHVCYYECACLRIDIGGHILYGKVYGLLHSMEPHVAESEGLATFIIDHLYFCSVAAAEIIGGSVSVVNFLTTDIIDFLPEIVCHNRVET